MTDKFRDALESWPVDVNLKLGLGPTYEDIGNWFCKHAGNLHQALTIAAGLQDQAQIPPDMVLVPREPTAYMRGAGLGILNTLPMGFDDRIKNIADIYRAMIAAAQKGE